MGMISNGIMTTGATGQLGAGATKSRVPKKAQPSSTLVDGQGSIMDPNKSSKSGVTNADA